MRTTCFRLRRALPPVALAISMFACGSTAEVAETYGQTAQALAGDAEPEAASPDVAIDGASDVATVLAEAAVGDAPEAAVGDAAEAAVVADADVSALDASEGGRSVADAGSEGGKDGGQEAADDGSGATREAGAMFGSFEAEHLPPTSEGGCSAGGRSEGTGELAMFGILGILGVLGAQVSLRRRS
jgi:hypothetical protein